MEAVLWTFLAISAWLALVLPLAVACGRAFAAGETAASPRVHAE